MEARNNRVILAIGRSEIDVMQQWVHGASVYGCGRRWPSRRFGSGSGTLNCRFTQLSGMWAAYQQCDRAGGVVDLQEGRE